MSAPFEPDALDRAAAPRAPRRRFGLLHLVVVLGLGAFLTGCVPDSSQGRKDANGGFGSHDAGTPDASCPLAVHTLMTLREVTFTDKRPVDNDTANVGTTGSSTFSTGPDWMSTRTPADPADHPVCYVRNTTITLTAKFTVTRAPSVSESVVVTAQTIVGGVTLTWTSTLTVAPGATEATVSPMVSSAPLPNVIDCIDPMSITWTYQPTGVPTLPGGVSNNVVYVILGAPTGTPLYWTLLDISCRAAHGKSSADDLMAGMATRFATRVLPRKRDSLVLTYWKTDFCNTTGTRAMLASPEAWGQCGAFAEFMRDMLAAHGVAASKIGINVVAPDAAFLVKHWRYVTPPPTSPTALTHRLVMPAPATPAPGTVIHSAGMGVPGQGNPNPPPAFENHFIIKYGGRYYDPSYGAGPVADQHAWEAASIDGVLRHVAPPPPPPPPPPPALPPPPPPPPPNTGFVGSPTNLLTFTVL